MHLAPVSPHKHLSWDANRRSFRILDSTDRKIMTFVGDSVVSCYFFRGQLLKIYSGLEKKFTWIKSHFLAALDRQSARHIADSPVEEFKEHLRAFYQELRQQVSDLRENEHALLLHIVTGCFKRLFSKPPLNMRFLALSELGETNQEFLKVLREGQCYHFAFYLRKEYQVMMSMTPFESPVNTAFILYPKYFIKLLGYSETQTPTTGDLGLFLGNPKLDGNNCRFKHLGVMTERGTVKSYWFDMACNFEHSVFQVSDDCGFEVFFFHRELLADSHDLDDICVKTNRISELILQFESQVIPTPLNVQGALLFLFGKLRAACVQAYPASERWDWSKMQANLLEELLPKVKHAEILKEFQVWMQDIFQDYFIKLD